MSFADTIRADCPWAELSDSQLAALERHHDLLQRWNPKLNLTATLDIRKHFGEALFLGTVLREYLPGIAAIADIGSGGGFPGLPLGVQNPEWRVTLVESDRRKAVFLREAAGGQPNVEVLTERAENLKSRYDWLVSRAVQPELVAKAAVRVAGGVAMILRDPPQVAGVETLLTKELPWAGTGNVWVARVVPRGT